MVLPKINRNIQIIIYAIILILVVVFFFYFYRQAMLTQADFAVLKVDTTQTKTTINSAAVNMNLNLFDSDKFLNLRSEVAPVQSFQSGKRNPFQPQ